VTAAEARSGGLVGALPACPACGTAAPTPFFRLAGLPVHGTAVFATAAQARATETGDQELVLCERCGVVFNRAFDAARLDYGGAHEESQHHSPRFAAYAAELSAEWVRRYGLAGRRVVEVGCGSGDFAVELVRAGIRSVDGIDPHFPAERVPPEWADRIVAVPEVFRPELVPPGAAALVCRHTLEHIPALAEFGASVLHGMRAAGVPVLLVEVPDLGRILADGAFWDLQYEHCSYFTPATLAAYLQRLGFESPQTRTTYADQYVVAEAAPGPPARPATVGVELDALQRSCVAFAGRTRDRIGRWASWFDRCAAAGDPVVVWGGGAKGLTFLNVLAQHAGAVRAVVDVNPGLQGRYVGGIGLPIRAPEQLPDAPPRSVLLMNPVYEREVRTMLDGLGLTSTELHTV
jgi:hypothetical protein